MAFEQDGARARSEAPLAFFSCEPWDNPIFAKRNLVWNETCACTTSSWVCKRVAKLICCEAVPVWLKSLRGSVIMSKTHEVFITGVAGFIGFHLASVLHSQGHCVHGCDNFNDYYDPLLKRLRSQALIELGVSVADVDVRDAAQLKCEFSRRDYTHLVHLAGQAGVRPSIDSPHLYLETNVMGLLNALELARSKPSTRVVFASSSSVYGANSKIPFAEADPADSPMSPYAASKKAGELLAHTYHHLYGITTTCLRFFTVYGPWGRPDMAYFKFARAIVEGESIALFNNGNMYRDFTYIDDLIDGIVAALSQDGSYEVINLGNDRSEKLLDMVRYLEDALGYRAKITHLPMQQGDVLTTHADISKARALLGYAPKVKLQEGLERFARWYTDFRGSAKIA